MAHRRRVVAHGIQLNERWQYKLNPYMWPRNGYVGVTIERGVELLDDALDLMGEIERHCRECYPAPGHAARYTGHLLWRHGRRSSSSRYIVSAGLSFERRADATHFKLAFGRW